MNPNDITEIIPQLFISNWATSNNPAVLKKYKINAIITLEQTPKSKQVLDYYKSRNIDHYHIYIPDSPNFDIQQYFDSTYDFIKYHIERGDNVLIHCMAGISRSATIILNYIIRSGYETYIVNMCPCKFVDNVLEFARSKRSIINPNQGFMRQLVLSAIKYRNIYR